MGILVKFSYRAKSHPGDVALWRRGIVSLLSSALDMSRHSSMGEVAVLNFANSVNLGGGGNMGLWIV